MRVWILAVAEPLPLIDQNFRPFRCSLLSDALISQGHEVIWWTSDFDHMRKVHRFDRSRSLDIRPGLKINLLHAPGYRRNVSMSRVLHNLYVARLFGQAAEGHSDPPDILFACLPILELAERAAVHGQTHHVPCVVDIRDQWPDLYLNAFSHRLRGLARLALASEFTRLRRILRAASGITAVSETYLSWALNHAGRDKQDTDEIFPLGYPELSGLVVPEVEVRAEELRTKYGIRPDSLNVTFVGTFGASYDLETVIRTAKELGNVPGVQIVLAGDGDAGPKLREMGRDLGNVIFTGWLDQTSISALLSLSSVGLAPYTDEALQSLPNKPYEYWAAGLPILSSLKGELETLIEKEEVGLQYKSGDVSSLIQGIRWFLGNQNARDLMAYRARRLFERSFSTRIIYPKLVEYLERVHNDSFERRHCLHKVPLLH